MSLARITQVTRAMKDQGVCEAADCGTEIKKGDSYLWYKVGFRSRHKHVRCVDHPPRPSERESSLVASVYGAQEDFADQVGSLDTADDIREAVQVVAEAAREVAGEYEAAMYDQNGNVWNTEAEERYNTLEAAADDLDSWQPDEDEPTPCAEHEDGEEIVEGCDDCSTNVEEWLETTRTSASEAVDGIELP